MTVAVDKNMIMEDKNENVRGMASFFKTISSVRLVKGFAVLLFMSSSFIFVSEAYPSFSSGQQLAVTIQKSAGEIGEDQLARQLKVEEESGKKKEGEAPQEEINLIIPLDAIIVNLSGAGGKRYLKIKINLEAKDAEAKKKIESKSIPIKDRLITILSSKTYEDIEGIEGQETLRREIRETVEVLLKTEGCISQVYFSELVVQ